MKRLVALFALLLTASCAGAETREADGTRTEAATAFDSSRAWEHVREWCRDAQAEMKHR